MVKASNHYYNLHLRQCMLCTHKAVSSSSIQQIRLQSNFSIVLSLLFHTLCLLEFSWISEDVYLFFHFQTFSALWYNRCFLWIGHNFLLVYSYATLPSFRDYQRRLFTILSYNLRSALLITHSLPISMLQRFPSSVLCNITFFEM